VGGWVGGCRIHDQMYFIKNILYKKNIFIVVGGDAVITIFCIMLLLISNAPLHSAKAILSSGLITHSN
jgi:hypothetical protein